MDVRPTGARAAVASLKAIKRTNAVVHSCSTSTVDADKNDGRRSSGASSVNTATAPVSVNPNSASSGVTRAPASSALAFPTTPSPAPSLGAATVEAFPRAPVNVAVQCSPMLLEVLDLSYSGWWRRPTIGDPGKPTAAPLTSLLKALAEEGFCPRLKTLGLSGCHLGDEEVESLALAVENGCRSMRLLDNTDNLFTEVGVHHLMKALLSGRMLTHLRMRVYHGPRRFGKELHAAMTPDDVAASVDDWIVYQNRML